MTRVLLALVIALLAVSVADAAHRGLFGVRERARHVTRDRHVERGAVLERFRGGSGCAGIQAGGCIGTVSAAPAMRTGAGCSGWTGPSLPPPVVKSVPAPMPPRTVLPLETGPAVLGTKPLTLPLKPIPWKK